MANGKGGRPRDPVRLQLVKGVRDKSRINHDDPSLQLPILNADDLPMPETLTRPVAVQRWEYYAPRLAPTGVLTEWDVQTLEAYCQSYADSVELRKVFEDEGRFLKVYQTTASGEIVKDAKGKPVIESVRHHPAVSQHEKAEARFRSYSIELGLTPAARGKVKVSKPTEADPSEKYFGKTG